MTQPSIEDIQFVHLGEVDELELVDLMNNERVKQHLPLLVDGFSAEQCRAFVADKQRLWHEHGYGPWAILVGGAFAGWGGLQPEQGDADFALVLHPKFWGWGRRIFDKCRRYACEQLKLDSITLLLPDSRLNAAVVRRLGFVDDGAVNLGDAPFKRFRLMLRP